MELEKLVDEQVKKIVEKTIKNFIGVSIKELNKDITSKLKKNPLLEFHIDTSLSLKSAKKLFRKSYLERLLKSNFGDITAVAKICLVDRKTIHRMINELNININQCRKALLKQEYVKREALNFAIEETLKHYEKIIHPNQLSKVYKNVDVLSKNILNKVSLNWPTLKEAENEFEKKFIIQALKENGKNITKTARMLGIRFETLHRKMKKLYINIRGL
ncbi:MAG: helix-turn-helix domain-containing protein [Nanoarchaeota archaeon]|nr:helix-turn-helix domain-containing protein [Nanoarchaeota archaeon]